MDVTANEELANRYIQEWTNEHKLEITDEIVAEDVEFHGPTTSLHSSKDLIGFHETLLRAWGDFKFDVVKIKTSSKSSTIHGKLKGAHVGEIWGIPPTGKNFEVQATIILKIRGGKIAIVDVQYDTAAMLKQLGVLRL